jgi:hypothetical protein
MTANGVVVKGKSRFRTALLLPQRLLFALVYRAVSRYGSGLSAICLIPVMRVPPDFLDVEGGAAAKVDGLVFFGHAEALVVVKGLE